MMGGYPVGISGSEGMPQDRSRDRKPGSRVIGRTALGAGLCALLVCANAAAVRAGDSDDPDESFLSKFERALGLKNPGTMEYGINYSERSPLVVPPNRDLPPPQAAVPPPVPNWPKDPDIAQREKAKVKSKDTHPVDWVYGAGRPLPADQLDPSGAPRTSSGDVGARDSRALPDDRYSNPAQKSIFTLDVFKKEEYATFTGEPARESLTDPPPGYRVPSPDQPYGIAPEKQRPHVATPAEHGEVTH